MTERDLWDGGIGLSCEASDLQAVTTFDNGSASLHSASPARSASSSRRPRSCHSCRCGRLQRWPSHNWASGHFSSRALSVGAGRLGRVVRAGRHGLLWIRASDRHRELGAVHSRRLRQPGDGRVRSERFRLATATAFVERLLLGALACVVIGHYVASVSATAIAGWRFTGFVQARGPGHVIAIATIRCCGFGRASAVTSAATRWRGRSGLASRPDCRRDLGRRHLTPGSARPGGCRAVAARPGRLTGSPLIDAALGVRPRLRPDIGR